jgi:hypothetical protein
LRLLFAVAIVMARMLYAMTSVVEYVVEYIVDQLLPSKTQFATSLQ